MAEGDFPKTDGDVYYASEVNKINNNALVNSKLTSAAISNGLGLTGSGALGSYLIDMAPYSTGVLDTETNLSFTNQYAYVANSLSYVAETGEFVMPANVQNLFVNVDYFIEKELAFDADVSSEKVIRCDFYAITATNGTAYLQFDGTGSAGAETIASITTSGANGIGCGGGEAYFYLDWTNKSLVVVINYSVESRIQAGTSGLNRVISETYRYDLTGWTTFFVTFTESGGAGSSEMEILGSLKSTYDTTAVLSVSADGGSNYQVINNNSYNEIIDTGSSLKVKLAGTTGADERLVLRRIQLLPYF